MGEPQLTDVTTTHGWDTSRDRARGQVLARGATSPRGQTILASLEPDYEPEGPSNPTPPSLALDATPSV